MAKTTIKVDKSKQAQLQEQAKILKDRMSTNAASVVAYREASGDYGDMSEQSQQEWLFVNRNRATTTELGLIEGALQRIKDGTYGICAHCEEPISAQRLRAVPWAKYCIQCEDSNSGTTSPTAEVRGKHLAGSRD
jgi:DnaK suppressor protein